MAEPAIVTFGSSDEEGDDIDPEGSDIEVEEVDSDEDEDEEDVQENDNGDNVADAIGEEPTWSNVLSDFVINQFNGQPGIKVKVPEEATSDFFFNLIFGYEMVDLIVRETNRYARQKLANNARLEKWKDTTREEVKAYLGICLVMGINNLPRLAMYWSSDPFIGNTGIQNVMTKNRFEELSQYLHFSNSATEPRRGEENFDRLYKVRPLLTGILENVQKAYEKIVLWLVKNINPFMSRGERGNVYNVSKLGEERRKDIKSRHVMSAVCARSRSAAHVIMTSTIEHNKNLLFLLYGNTVKF